jgi:hypothetical protein
VLFLTCRAQVVLDHISPSGTVPEQEIVHAKFVVGADGEICSNWNASEEVTTPSD